MDHSRSPHADALIRAGLNLIQQALSIYDSDLRLVASNRMFQEMFGLPEALVTPGARFDDTIRFLVANGEYGEVEEVEAFVRDRTDQARAFEPHYIERPRANGRIVSVEGAPLPQGGWVAVYTDITSIKQQEELLRARSENLEGRVLENAERLSAANRELAATNAALEEAKRELTEMEARARLTAEMMPAHIARIGLDERYTYSNRRLNSVLPARPSAILGLHISEALGPSTFAKIKANLARAQKGEANVFEFTDELSTRRIRAAFTPDLTKDGNLAGVYILSMDVTEEAQARAALSQTHKRELAAKLTSGLAHDFSNLLTIILGTQSRLAKLAESEDASALIAATTGAARRGGELLDKLAQISGPPTLRPAPTDLPALLRDVVTLSTPSLPMGIRLSATAKGLEGPVMLDPGSLQDTLINLVLNACDAIGAGPGVIEITALQVSDTWIEITVTDTGHGFSDEALAHGLDPFFTTKGSAGSGLGLSMVYDLTQLAGGTVRLSNGIDGGAKVVLRLPLRVAQDHSARGQLVLLVEDDPDIRANVREMLIEQGQHVIEAASVPEARELAGIDGINLVLSDLSLGGETGLDLAAALETAGVGAPVRIMTSRAPSDPLRQRAEARLPVLSKPFGAADLALFLSVPDAPKASEARS